MTEQQVQDTLYKSWVPTSHVMTIPNCKALGIKGEADLISVTKSLFVHEIEIKITKRDFLADFKNKTRKHRLIQEAHDSEPKSYNIPANYFWFATPFDINPPEYAGHIQVNENGVEIIKKAPRIHNQKANERVLRYIARGINLRYWNTRIS